MFENAEIIHRYTRADAIADGVLVAADTVEDGICASAGFTAPVAFTAAAWADTVAWNDDTEEGKREFTGQRETGRLWDVLTMARHAARTSGNTSRVDFKVLRITPEGTSSRATLAGLTLHIGPGDEGEPVITIMCRGED